MKLDNIIVKDAYENNLKHIDLSIPKMNLCYLRVFQEVEKFTCF